MHKLVLCLVVVVITGRAFGQACGWEIVSSEPDGRYFAAMAYDSGRNTTVLFGGSTSIGVIPATINGTTMEWDGTDWRTIKTPFAPAPRSLHHMAFDSIRNVVVLQGGLDSNGFLHDTWEWNGQYWFTSCNEWASRLWGGDGLRPDSGRNRHVWW